MNRLNGKVALVTGAARGIGAAIAKAFVDEGAFVYLADVNDDLGTKTAAALRANAEYIHLDVQQEADWQSATRKATERHGKLDIVVNNAGVTGLESAGAHDPEHATLEDWRRVHQVNLDGVFLGCKYAIQAMRKQLAGSIINISSRSGMVGVPGAAAYASSKAAVRNHTKTVALYCAEQGLDIRCNSIHPGAILTAMWEPFLGTGPERKQRLAALVKDAPLKRFGAPEEVAAVAVLLASDAATYMTGAELSVDGGLAAGSTATPKTQ